MKSKRTSAEDFVHTWMEHKDYAEVAKELGVSKTSVMQRVKFYRKKGVKLPLPPNRNALLNVSMLNEIVRSYR
jgi:transposase